MVLTESSPVQIGWQAQHFALPDPEGHIHSFDAVHNNKPLVVAFICNHCPYVKAIAHRLAVDAQSLSEENIGFVAINSNDYSRVPADSPPLMKEFAAQHGFGFPYLVDEDQSIARTYDAVCTPDFFGFNSNGVLQYRGRLDDARMEDPSHRVPELINAMRMIAQTGQGPTEQHPSIGCSIKWRK